MFIFLIFVAIFGVIFVFVWNVQENQAKEMREFQSALNSLPDFKHAPELVLINNFQGGVFQGVTIQAVSIQEDMKRIAIVQKRNNGIQTFIFPCTSVIGVEVEERQGKTVPHKKGVFNSTTETYLESVTLCVSISDLSLPLLRIPMYVAAGEPNGSTKVLEQRGIVMAKKYQSIFSSVISLGQGKPEPDLEFQRKNVYDPDLEMLRNTVADELKKIGVPHASGR